MKTFLFSIVLAFCNLAPAFAQWEQMTTPFVNATGGIVVSGTNVFVGTDTSGIFLSTDDGASWNPVNAGLPTREVVYCMLVNGTSILAGVGDSIFATANGGSSWISINSGLTDTQQIYSLALFGSTLFTGTAGGVFRSANSGAEWESADSDMPGGTHIGCFGVNGAYLFAGTLGGSAFRTANNGDNWTPVNTDLATMITYAFASAGGSILLGTYDGVFLSTNDGDNWLPANVGLPLGPIVRSFAVDGTNLFASVNGEVYLSTAGGAGWTSVSTGLTSPSVNSLALGATYLFAAGAGVWRRPLSEITSVKHREDNLPSRFSLGQNYPNPFNPGTSMEYTLWSRTFVTIRIFDLLGQEVAELLGETVEEGVHSVRWEASGMPSGTYICRFEAGEFVESRPMILLR